VTEPCSRRVFLARLSMTAGGIAAGAVAIPAALFASSLRKVPAQWRPVGVVERFALGATVLVSLVESSPLPWAGVTARTAAWLRREGPAAFRCFSVTCTHLGCPVRWLPEAELFMCPCHGGVYYRDGTTASGPPPLPLAQYPVRVTAGTVEVLSAALPITPGAAREAP
jgi:menaquinol-cytochrome c reductase iron-sulfur subunit